MSDLIFGHTWEDIRAAQSRRGSLRKPIDLSVSGKPKATAEDFDLLKAHGSLEAIKNAGLWGVADRLSRENLD